MNFLISSSSASDEECDKPLYDWNCEFFMNVFSTLDDNWPNLYGTTGSQSPWHWRMGTVFGHFKEPGKFLCIGNQQDRAITPAKGSAKVSAAYSARAPPCENPPNIMRLAEIPACISLRIISWTFFVAFLMPSSSSGPPMSNVFRSNQDGIRNPAFRVTGIVGAVGQMTFMSGVRIMPMVVAHPWPVSPNPWRKMSVEVCLAADWMITGAAAIVSVWSKKWLSFKAFLLNSRQTHWRILSQTRRGVKMQENVNEIHNFSAFSLNHCQSQTPLLNSIF